MSRLMTKNPKKAIEVAHTLLSYVKGNPGDLHYTGKVHKVWGARGQLKVARHNKLIEVFADIAYGTGSGHRSAQGLAIYFGGVPIAWQSSSQPFTTHSTAEAELVSYCEALTAGRATEALLCTMWGEPLDGSNTFDRVIYGDNAAAIASAHGNSTTSWRTRHLRVRSHILREALEKNSAYPGGVWKLMHLKGTELVADGLTKPLLGQSFQNFRDDLGMQPDEVSLRAMGTDHRLPQLQDQNGVDRRQHQVHDQAGALRMLVAGSIMVQAAEAQGNPEPDSTFGALWVCGLILVAIGAIWVSKVACASLCCCLRRLQKVIIEPQDPLSFSEGEGFDRTSTRKARRTSLEGWATMMEEEEASTPTEEAGEAESEPSVEKPCLRNRRPRARSTEATTSRKSPMSQPTRRRSGSEDRSFVTAKSAKIIERYS